MKKPELICVFGDSTAWGAWDMEKGGWVNRLWLHTANRDENYVELYNLSISGGTTQTILDRFENEAKIRNADALIFQSGGNDSCLVSKDGSNHVEIEIFESNLRKIIEGAKKITKNIVFIGFKNVDESKTTPVPWIDYYYLNSEINRYNEVMQKVCADTGVLYVNMLNVLTNEDLDDGIHPNAIGHQKIFEKVRDFLVDKNWI